MADTPFSQPPPNFNDVLDAAGQGDKKAALHVMDTLMNPWSPSGRTGINVSGKIEGARVGSADVDADEVILDKAELKERGKREIGTFWKNEERDIRLLCNDYWPINDLDLDHTEIHRVFVTGFMKGYQKEVEEARQEGRYTGPEPSYGTSHHEQPDSAHDSVSVRVVNTQETGGARIYEFELVDVGNAQTPVRFELQLNDDGEAELRESSDYA